MQSSLSGMSKKLLVLALASVLVGCGGGGGSGGGDDAGGSGGSGGLPADSTPDASVGDSTDSPSENPETPDTVAAVQWDTQATAMRDVGTNGGDPTIAISASGNVAVAWIEKEYPYSVWARFYDKSSDTWGQATQIDKGGVDADTYYDRTNPQVTFVGETAIVVWDQEGVVYSSIHDDSGWSGNPQVIGGQDMTIQAIGVSIAPLQDGSGALAMYELRDNSVFDSVPSMRSAEFSLATGTWSAPVDVGQVGSTVSYGVQMVTDPESGHIHAAWEAPKAGGTGANALVTASYKDGAWGSVELIDYQYINSATIQPDPSGDRPILVWAGQGVNDGITAARYSDADGWVLAAIGNYGTGTTDIESVTLADGDIVIAYGATTSNGIDHIVRQRMEIDDGVWSDAVPTDNSYMVDEPSLAADAQGRVVLAYRNINTWVTDYTEANGWSADFQPLRYNSGAENKVVMNAAGEAALIWSNTNNGRGVYVLFGQ